MEPTIVLSDLNTNYKLVFSLALAMTFTTLPPWRLARISYLYYLASLVCVCVCAPVPLIVLSMYQRKYTCAVN